MDKILIFDDYPSIRELLAEELADDGNAVVPIANSGSIAGLVVTFEPDLFILDPCVRGKMKWELFDTAKTQNPTLPILLFTEWSPVGSRFSKADAYVPKSHNLDQL